MNLRAIQRLNYFTLALLPNLMSATLSHPASGQLIFENTFKPSDDRIVLWFDIDNTLYTKKAKINELMGEKIQAYFLKLGLPEEEATALHKKYYKEYGLAIRGLVRHHTIDPLDYNRHCDAALPLDEILKPDLELRQLLEDIDRSKARVWAITNAYRDHASRVLKLLQVEDQFEAVVSCDYAKTDFACKPEPEYYALAQTYPIGGPNISSPEDPFPTLPPQRFVDDSLLNIRGAISFGWDKDQCILLDEDGEESKKLQEGEEVEIIASLEELRARWKDVFKLSESSMA